MSPRKPAVVGFQRRAWLQGSGAAVLGGLPAWLEQTAAAATGARRHAVLVGVSALVQQARELWLQGPRHDVPAMQGVLAAHGFALADQTVVADGVRGAAADPTRATVLQALADVARRIRPGDVVLLYWSGHAVKADGPAKALPEADGQATFLLAGDAARAPSTDAWPLRGAVADAELGAFVDDWLALGAHVCVVLDTCHAASATRAAPAGWRWRGLRVADLDDLQPPLASDDPPPVAVQPGRLVDRVMGRREDSTAASIPARLPAPHARPTGYVAFYACESRQRTPEWQLDGVSRGLFTEALVQSLAQTLKQQPEAGASMPRATGAYTALAAETLDRHAALARRSGLAASAWPSPVFEGSLQAPLWTRQPMPETTVADVTQRPAGMGVSRTVRPAGFDIRLQIRPSERAATFAGGRQRQIDTTRSSGTVELGRLPVGSVFELALVNTGGQALDLRIVYLDAQGRLRTVYPQLAGDAARLAAGTVARPARWQHRLVIDRAETAPESLVLMVAPTRPHQLPRDVARDSASAGWAAAWQVAWRWLAVA